MHSPLQPTSPSSPSCRHPGVPSVSSLVSSQETTVLDHGRGQELLVKDDLHIEITPVEEYLNQDGGLEVCILSSGVGTLS